MATTNVDCREFKMTPVQMRAGLKSGFEVGTYDLQIVTRHPIEGGFRVAAADSIGLKVENREAGRSAVFGPDGSVISADADGWLGAHAAPLASLQAFRALLERFVSDPAPVFAAVGKA